MSQPLIRPEHILLALCEDEGSTGRIFAKQGIKCEHLRRLVDELLDTLITLRKYLENDPEQQKRIDRIEWILRNYFRK